MPEHLQFPDVLRLKVATQANRGLSALRSLFDLHVPVTLIETSAPGVVHALCQRKTRGIHEDTGPREIAESSGILIFQKKCRTFCPSELLPRDVTMPQASFRADQPFLFLIRDQQTGTILFAGHVTQP